MRPSVLVDRGLSTRVRLVILVAAVLLPVVLFAAALLWPYSNAERDRQLGEALGLAQRLSAAIDRELNGLTAALEALATAPAVQDSNDLAAFDTQARALLRSRGSFIAMRDRTGQQIINTSRPFGTRLPVSTDPTLLATDQQVFDKGRPVISDLYTGTVTGLQLVLIDAPVFQGGGVAYALNIALDPARLTEILLATAPQEWTLALLDRQDRILARSPQDAHFLRSEEKRSLQATSTDESGTWVSTTPEGTEYYGAYTRSTLSGWRTVVGVPASVIFGPLQRLLGALAVSALVVLLLSIALAVWFARQISAPLDQLARTAEQLGRGNVVLPIVTALREANVISHELTTASLNIAQRRAALLASEERFRAAVRAVNGVVWTNDANGQMSGQQLGWSELTGQSQPEYEGDGWTRAIHPDDAQPTIEAWTKAVAERATFVFEHRVRRRDGNYRLHSVRAVPVLNQDGTIREWVGVHTDVTEEREARAALAESQARLKAVFDAVPVGVVIGEAPSGRLVDGNAQAERVFGHPIRYSPTVDDYKDWVAYHPDGRQVQGREYPLGRVIMHGEERPELEALCDRGDGARSWVRIIGAPIRDEDGRITGGVVAIVDIDREKRADAELRDLNARLEQRVEDTIAERDRIWRLSTELMLVARFDAEIVAINPAWQTILGWTEDDLVGTSFMELVHPGDVEDTAREAGRLSEGVRTHRFENRYRHKDGSYRWLSWTAVPDPTFIHAIARDVTGEQEAAEALRRAEEQLRHAQKMEAVGQLTGGIAHDFNNLLTGISGSLEMLQTRIRQGRLVDLDRYINAAQGASKRAAALTHRLLAFSRRQTLDPKPTDVNPLVAGMEELIRRSVGPSIEIEFLSATSLWPALVDPNQLENALLNLCINARDAMPDGGRITIETANNWLDHNAGRELDLPPGEYLSLCVTDSGTGMTPDVVARAFDPFFTTKPIGEGTGLGLSMIYGFARQSGGQVRIKTEVGQGTTMCIYLPRYNGAKEAEQDVPDLTSAPRAEAGETVLIVDDEPAVRMLVMEVLEDLGYAAIEAADASAGLKVLQSDVRIDLLITDVGLPGGMNGRQMADAARMARSGLKVLFITGYAANAAVGNGLLAPGMEVITKPFVMEALASRIKDLLNQ